MSAAKISVAGLVLFALAASACSNGGAAEARARADQAEARVATLQADLVIAELATADEQAELAAVTATVRQLEEDLAAVRADLHEKELLLAGRDDELGTLRAELEAARADAADLSARLGQLQALSSLGCSLPSDGLPAQALPAAVAETRARIHAAAIGCDWLELHRLAEEAGGIAYADGAVGWDGDPVPWWLANPDELRLVAGVLEISVGVLETQDENGNPFTVYIWPAVALEEHRTQADWAELRRVYTDEYLAQIQEWGEGYAGGFVVAIREDGTWLSALHVSV